MEMLRLVNKLCISFNKLMEQTLLIAVKLDNKLCVQCRSNQKRIIDYWLLAVNIHLSQKSLKELNIMVS